MPFASAAATTAFKASSHSVLGHYFASLMGYTGFLVLLGITLIWLIKRHPHKIAWLFPSLKQTVQAQAPREPLPAAPIPTPASPTPWGVATMPMPHNPALLHIEASVTLEAGQTLHVVQAQGQRLLVSSGVAGVQVLAPLSLQQPALEALNQATTAQAAPLPVAPKPELPVAPPAPLPARNPLPNPTHYPTPPLPMGSRSRQAVAPAPAQNHPGRAFFETLRQAIPPENLSLSTASPQPARPPHG